MCPLRCVNIGTFTLRIDLDRQAYHTIKSTQGEPDGFGAFRMNIPVHRMNA